MASCWAREEPSEPHSAGSPRRKGKILIISIERVVPCGSKRMIELLVSLHLPASRPHTRYSLTARYLLLAPQRSLLTAHCSLLTPHGFLLTTHSSLITAHCSPVSRSPCPARQYPRTELPRQRRGAVVLLPKCQALPDVIEKIPRR